MLAARDYMLMWQYDARFTRKCVNGLTPLRYLYSALGVNPFVFLHGTLANIASATLAY